MGWQKWLLLVVLAFSCMWALVKAASRSPVGQADPPAYVTSGVFTPAHPTASQAVRDFLDFHPEHPVQPIAYTHAVHLANGMKCEDCHVGVDKGSDARIPGVSDCMTCHQVIATDRPEIKKIAAYAARGEDISWVRVYSYSDSAHVKFNHAPHIRAHIECATCHGDMTKQTTAERKKNLNMGYCIDCHRQKQVSIDCDTCHI
jgi:hypothetical protein